MTGLLTCLAFGSLWFWLVTLVVSLFIIIYLENDRASGATFFSICGLIAIVGLGNSHFFTWISSNPFIFLGCILGYFAVGVGYGIFRWWLLLEDTARRYREKRTEWLKSTIRKYNEEPLNLANKTEKLTGELLEAWKDNIKFSWKIAKPSLGENRERIISWMIYWPWSGFWLLMNEPVSRTFKFLYRVLRGFLQHMSDVIFADIDDELNEEEKKNG